MTDVLTLIGNFIENPPRGVVIILCWMFVPLLTLAFIQRMKRVARGSGYAISDLCIEGMAIFMAVAFSLMIMVGLYALKLREAFIHAILISVSYTVGVKWWMGWAKVNKPEMYQAFRTDRRADDTQEFRLGGSDGR